MFGVDFPGRLQIPWRCSLDASSRGVLLAQPGFACEIWGDRITWFILHLLTYNPAWLYINQLILAMWKLKRKEWYVMNILTCLLPSSFSLSFFKFLTLYGRGFQRLFRILCIGLWLPTLLLVLLTLTFLGEFNNILWFPPPHPTSSSCSFSVSSFSIHQIIKWAKIICLLWWLRLQANVVVCNLTSLHRFFWACTAERC